MTFCKTFIKNVRFRYFRCSFDKNVRVFILKTSLRYLNLETKCIFIMTLLNTNKRTKKLSVAFGLTIIQF